MRVAQVIINRPAKQLHKPLSYLMPEKFGNVLPGTRVLIPLGHSREEGILIGYDELVEPPEFTLRNIVQVLDSEPWFTPEMMDTARRLNEYYLFSYGDALRLFTVNKTLKSYEAPKEEWLVVMPEFSVAQFSERKKKQRELAKYLLEVGGASKEMCIRDSYIVVNDDLAEASEKVASILRAESCKISRNKEQIQYIYKQYQESKEK